MIIRSIDAIIRMLDADYIENADIEEKIQGVCIDSRKVVEGNQMCIRDRYIHVCQSESDGVEVR